MPEPHLDEALDPETRLAQFNRLIQSLLKGSLNRNTFRPWEIELLLDIDGCSLANGNRREILKRYQKAVQRHFERGGKTMLKLSDYLEQARSKRRNSAE
jgi:hypothetical protein